MSAKYWIAKYVENPFRNEPRNVGIIVLKNGIVAGKFVGERDNGTLDNRKLRGFSHASVYGQWCRYWQRKIRAKDIEAIVNSDTANYAVASGGEVTDTGDDDAATICRFLYGLLVGGGLLEAYEWGEEQEGVALSASIILELDRIALLEKAGQLFARYPIRRSQSIYGKSIEHTPSFSQRNGKLTVMEYIDLSGAHINKTKERAGWMAFMYRDIKDSEPTADAISLVRPEGDSHSDQITYAKKILGVGSRVVNWLDENEKGAFLQERKMIAEPGLYA